MTDLGAFEKSKSRQSYHRYIINSIIPCGSGTPPVVGIYRWVFWTGRIEPHIKRTVEYLLYRQLPLQTWYYYVYRFVLNMTCSTIIKIISFHLNDIVNIYQWENILSFKTTPSEGNRQNLNEYLFRHKGVWDYSVDVVLDALSIYFTFIRNSQIYLFL